MVGAGSGVGGGDFLRQISGRESRNSSKRWNRKGPENSMKKMEGLNISDNGLGLRKRVMVVIDHSERAKTAMLWALTHVTNKGDLLTLLQIIPPHKSERNPLFGDSSPHLANSLGSLCKACKPDVEVEALIIQGPKLPIVISQVKKLEASILVLGQKKPSAINWQDPHFT